MRDMRFPSDCAHAAPRQSDGRSGQIIIFVTLSLFFLFSAMGLAVDLGYSYYVKISGQNAADAAATAAMRYAIDHGYTCGADITCDTPYTCPSPVGTVNSAFKAGCVYAQTNLNSSSQTVTLTANNNTPPYATGVSTSLWIQATVAQTVTHSFLYWAGFHSSSVQAMATAGFSSISDSSCIYVLDNGNTSGALTVSGAATLTALSCGIYVNSSNSTNAIKVTGSAKIVASQISVVGKASCTVATVCNPVPTTNAAPVTDPLANRLTPPSVSGTCTHNDYSLGNSNVATISADGVYCGGISVTGAAKLKLHGGTYILKDGPFSVGNSGQLTADGPVTIYMTAPTAGKSSYVSLGGAGAISISAPTSGSYRGILFYQDPDHPGSTASTIANSGGLSATGTFYIPKTALNLSGAISSGKMALVVKDLSVSNSASFQQDLTGNFTGLAQQTAALIQ